jgi:hypothetical protein
MKTNKTKLQDTIQTQKHGNDLVTVAKYGNALEAHLASTKLQSRKIKSYVFDENLISLIPVYDIGLGGVRLKVRESDFDKAARVLGNKVRGSFWVPRPLVFATHFFSGYVFGILSVAAVLFIFLIKKLIF